jgi:Tol biopolymer transport system component
VLNLETNERKELGVGECNDVRYVSSGHVLYTKGNEVFAIGWDVENQEVIGKGKRVLEGVRRTRLGSQLEVSEEGTLIYEVEPNVGGDRSLVWVEVTEEGNVEVERFTERSGGWRSFALSSDEKKVAIEEAGDLYIIEQVSEGFDQLRPFVTGAGVPVWSRDGEWLYYRTAAGNKSEIWKKKAEFSPGRGELVYSGEENVFIYPNSVSPGYLTMSLRGNGREYDLLRLELKGGSGEAEVMYEGDYIEAWSEISPDGKWLAYYTEESGMEIYLAPMEGSRAGRGGVNCVL